ncbi:MAG: tRNA threonylcarbamoyladenosine dehydratase [Bacteroidales bacterium]|nr:tRNA threonylcarbamoyladenosine dehydratase [Candidatus Cacconaster caballi]
MWTDRTAILTGEEGLAKLRGSFVAVIGLGGVGAVAAEMVARSGVGRMLILDSDTVSETNRNRQTIAFCSTEGKMKSEVLSSRLMDINPQLRLEVVNDYLTKDNTSALLGGYKPDFLIDAIDTLAPKLALIEYCMESGIPLVSSMGSGAKYDVTRIRITDISKSFNCPLAYIVRKKLRHRGISKGFQAVFSEELPVESAIVEMTLQEQEQVSNKKSQVGTISYLPAAFGCACAQAAITAILKK